MNIKNLIDIANRSKTIGGGKDYILANTVFAVICDYYLEYSTSKILKRKSERIWIEIESQDRFGEYGHQTYYDVCTIKRQFGDTEQSLCIPVPLLTTMTAVTLIKRGAEFVGHENHSRTFEEGEAEEDENLWNDFLEIISDYYSREEIPEVVNRHINR